ncbi:MAG: hypothetical protein M1826_004345 [Phylliscum demangeonii]|nr:MAG: hypothetical protein M1826_004345 [Phylliscum demangeonii]
MSYAQAAAKGPKQTPEEVEHSDGSTTSLVDVDSVHVAIVPSDYEAQPVKTDTQAERLEREVDAEERELEAEYENAKREAKREAKELSEQTKATTREAQAKAHDVKEDARQKAHDVKEEVRHKAHDVKHKAHDVKAKAEAETKKAADRATKVAKATSHDLQENKENPVYVANAVVVAALCAALGFGGYRKYAAGELTWKVVGAWAGVVGLFAAGDFYLSQYLVKNRYPRK